MFYLNLPSRQNYYSQYVFLYQSLLTTVLIDLKNSGIARTGMTGMVGTGMGGRSIQYFARITTIMLNREFIYRHSNHVFPNLDIHMEHLPLDSVNCSRHKFVRYSI